MNVTRIIAGLGNPGPRYHATRHNLGFMVADHLLGLAAERKSMRLHPVQTSGDALAYEMVLASSACLLLKPMTFMNLSGAPVARWCRRLGLGPEALVVLHDEMDLPLGRMKLKLGGSSNGHKGLESIMAELGSEEFFRLRLGIGRPAERTETTDWVLAPFSESELAVTAEVLPAAAKGLSMLFRRGPAESMQFLHTFGTVAQ